MNKFSSIFLPIVLVIAIFLIISQADAFSIKEFLGLETVENSEEEQSEESKHIGVVSDNQDWARQAAVDAHGKLDFTHIQKIFANLNVPQRKAYLENNTKFQQFVRQEADNLSVLVAAKQNNVDKDENTLYLMQRGAESILRESYLNKLIASKVPGDFPTDQQIREYYDKNIDKFVLEDRIHVWQIFLLVGKNMDKENITQQERQARDISERIKQGKLDFATAAAKYSDHEPSKVNGGYMGLLKVSELKPEIHKPLMALAQDKLSKPIKTDVGIHIVKRGAKLPEQKLSFDQVKLQIAELLKKQARSQLRQAIYTQASKTYPVEVEDSEVEKWRLRLRSDL